ncbi:MAG TPA: two-component regulator propeller domain-containing protein [Verrucomicrobiota bacterium]|nr:two-component regulator propeller domain-containing protein [Verrucomicrobiota bacterium]HNT14996.1 two-component regulator propeller domain-containing protein [Verrucomicrobiota bacterium]
MSFARMVIVGRPGRRLRQFVGGCWLLGCSLAAVAAPPSWPAYYDLRVWQTDEGLPRNTVTALAQAPDGYLWVGTRGGLRRFDGVRFTAAGHPDAAYLDQTAITALCTTHDGALWVGCEARGLTRLATASVQAFTQTNGLTDNQVQCLFAAQDGTLWIGSETGLTCFRDQKFTVVSTAWPLRNNSVKSLAESPGGILRVATVTGLISIDAHGRVQVDNFDLGPLRGILKAVWSDHAGQLWLGATDGLSCLARGRRTDFAENQSLPERIITAIREDRLGQLWVGTYGGLMRRVNGQVRAWARSKAGINDMVNTIYEDRERNLWVGGRDGLYRLTPTRFVSLTTQDGLSYNNVTSVCQDRAGNMWFGTWGGGVNRWRDGQFTIVTETNGLTHDTVLSLWPKRDGSLLVGMDTPGGVNQLTGDLTNVFQQNHELIPALVRVIYEDRRGTTWVGTARGLNALRGDRVDAYTGADGLVGSNITALCESRSGRLWVGTEAGLCYADEASPRKFATAQGVPEGYINTLYEDAATNLWISIRGVGVSRYRDGAVATYGLREGLASDEVFEILEDDAGNFWMSGLRGIFRVSRWQFDDPAFTQARQLRCTVFGPEDGLATAQCNGVARPSGWKSSDGRLWFASIRGALIVEPGIKLNALPPRVVIEEVTRDQQVLPRTTGARPGREGVRVPPGRGRLGIHFTALSLQAAEKNEFRYRVAKLDPQWIEAGHQRVAYFDALPPGRYEFEVLASNNDGIWATDSARLLLEVLPYFWQTWWFRVSVAALLLTAVGALYRVRVARLRGLEDLRRKIAADLHDDIGSRLTKLAMLTDSATREMPPDHPQQVSLQRISGAVQEMTRAMDEIVWTVNPRNDTLDSLANYIFHYAQEYFQHTHVRCRLQLPPVLPDVRISTGQRHNLFMAVKEALNNVLKHAAATEVQVSLEVTSSALTLTIVDNGRGHGKTAADPTGVGVQSMQQRLARIGGQFEMKGNVAGGTAVTLRLPGDWS